MRTSLTCPDVAALKRLVLGLLDPDEITRLQEHLARCPDCLATVGDLPTDDPLLRAMQAPPAAAGPEDEAVDRLVERLRVLGPSLSGFGSTDTLARDQAAAPDTPAEVGPESYDFLVAPRVPGELGRLGSYRVLRVLGSGGMGIVFEAEDPQLQRPVALKVMRPGMACHHQAGQRFLREARSTAAIEHDHIVTIHQVGEDRGVPYLAMQLLRGETLERRLQRDGRLPAAEAVRIGREIAEGLAAAHARGLIHRDIKPANIWLEAPGDGSSGSGRVKLLDFGLARAAVEPAHMTQQGIVTGTPAYMAPEQASDGPIDPRCDLFSLGCVLYRMCTGELPFKGTKPLTILWALAVKDPAPPRRLNPEVPPALSGLVLRLLAKDPADRPRSARAVAEALRAIECDLAAPPSPARRFRRRATLITAVALAALMGVGGALYGPAVYRLATDQGQLVIETDDPDVQVVVKQEEQQVTIIDGKTKQEVTLKAGKYQVELVPPKMGLGVSAREFTLTRGGKQVVQVRWEPPGPIQTLTGHKDIVWAAAFCLDGTHVLSAGGNRLDNDKWVVGSDFALRLWDARTGREVGRLEDHTEAVRGVAVSPDGRRAVSVGGQNAPDGKDFALRLWDLEKRKLVRRFPRGHTNRVNGVAFAADGKRVVSASDDGTARLWDVDTGQEVRTFRTGETGAVWSADISRDGKRVLSGTGVGVLRVWGAETGDLIKSLRVSERPLGSVTFSADGRHVLTQNGNSVRLWDLDAGKSAVTLNGHWGWVGRLAISPDGRRILSGSADMTVRLWDAATGKELQRYDGHQAPVYDVAFSPDGLFAVSASWDKTVRIWRLPE
jgi:WD40 repeat protein